MVTTDKLYIVLFARPDKGTYHWGVYNFENKNFYHITNKSGSWKHDFRPEYKLQQSKAAVTAVKI
ncbi:hypothetical protein CU098_006855, partial [Rhizopus stolonifer]